MRHHRRETLVTQVFRAKGEDHLADARVKAKREAESSPGPAWVESSSESAAKSASSSSLTQVLMHDDHKHQQIYAKNYARGMRRRFQGYLASRSRADPSAKSASDSTLAASKSDEKSAWEEPTYDRYLDGMFSGQSMSAASETAGLSGTMMKRRKSKDMLELTDTDSVASLESGVRVGHHSSQRSQGTVVVAESPASSVASFRGGFTKSIEHSPDAPFTLDSDDLSSSNKASAMTGVSGTMNNSNLLTPRKLQESDRRGTILFLESPRGFVTPHSPSLSPLIPEDEELEEVPPDSEDVVKAPPRRGDDSEFESEDETVHDHRKYPYGRGYEAWRSWYDDLLDDVEYGSPMARGLHEEDSQSEREDDEYDDYLLAKDDRRIEDEMRPFVDYLKERVNGESVINVDDGDGTVRDNNKEEEDQKASELDSMPPAIGSDQRSISGAVTAGGPSTSTKKRKSEKLTQSGLVIVDGNAKGTGKDAKGVAQAMIEGPKPDLFDKMDEFAERLTGPNMRVRSKYANSVVMVEGKGLTVDDGTGETFKIIDDPRVGVSAAVKERLRDTDLVAEMDEVSGVTGKTIRDLYLAEYHSIQAGDKLRELVDEDFDFEKLRARETVLARKRRAFEEKRAHDHEVFVRRGYLRGNMLAYVIDFYLEKKARRKANQALGMSSEIDFRQVMKEAESDLVQKLLIDPASREPFFDTEAESKEPWDDSKAQLLVTRAFEDLKALMKRMREGSTDEIGQDFFAQLKREEEQYIDELAHNLDALTKDAMGFPKDADFAQCRKEYTTLTIEKQAWLPLEQEIAVKAQELIDAAPYYEGSTVHQSGQPFPISGVGYPSQQTVEASVKAAVESELTGRGDQFDQLAADLEREKLKSAEEKEIYGMNAIEFADWLRSCGFSDEECSNAIAIGLDGDTFMMIWNECATGKIQGWLDTASPL